MSVLFIGPLPEPVTGQSLACQVLLEALGPTQRVTVVNLSKHTFRQGVSSLARVKEVLAILARVWREQRTHEVVYLTISESLAGNLKDLAIYALCRGRLGSVVVHLHGGAGLRELLREPGRPLARANRYFLRRIGACIVLGPRLADIFEGSVERARTFIVPNFAEDSSFFDVPGIEAKFRAVAPTRLLFLSNLIPGKGYLELLEAYRILQAESPGAFEIDFAGGFESSADEARFRNDLAGLPGARYHGVVRGAEKRALFFGAHVFLLPTYYPYEGQPISILEAYAAGCAVVTTNHSGVFDVFAPDANGFEVRGRSVESLVSCLRIIRGNPQSLAAVGLRNYRLACERFRADRYCREVIAVLDSRRGSSP
ncbi:MAG: glycosyltransferase family 4 protein [Dehalococcoidia bacterium]|nr:glycosyltransferase family 4 protein [Dehalococcoidia bacterium]